MKKLLVLIVCFFIQNGFSQSTTKTGTIEGKVVDESTGELLYDIKVSLDGTEIKTKTDFDGKYVLKGIPYGTYTVKVRSSTHTDKDISGVEVKSEELIYLDITVEPVTAEIKEIVVKHTKNKGDDVGTLATKKASANSTDVISAQTIARTPDRTTSDVLKRVSGASIQDNKFAIIRGLNDRYNAAYLNDGPLPSSESDRKAFSFDIFPANMLDNITIVKTATPDLPAEFAGGIIQINTKGIPSKNFQSLMIGGGYNTITTFQDRVDYQGGKWDWIGIDDGSRGLSSAIPSKQNYPLNIHDQASLAKQFNTNWGMQNKTFMPNLNLQYSLGQSGKIFGKEVGFVAALTYNRTNNYNQTIRRSYTNNSSGTSQIEFDYLDKVYSTQLLAGAMANFSIKLNQNNKIGFKNLYSINSDDRVIARSGEVNPLESNPTLLKSNALWFTSNNIYSGQLNGEHTLKNDRFKIHWVGSYSNIQRTIPGLKRSIYTRSKYITDPSDPNPMDTVYTANIAYSNVGPDYGGGMFSSTNKEQIASIKGDISYHFKKLFGVKSEMKLGGLYQKRDRSFEARQLGYTKYGIQGGNIAFKDSLLYLNENSIFAPQNMGLIQPGVGGFKLTDGSKYSDAYTANSSITAGYAMMDNKIHKDFRVVWGARAEYFTQNLNALRSDKSPLNIAVKKLDILPSLNAIYSLSKKQNLRFSFSQTLNRPEFRELAPFAFYDFNTQFVLSGNENLKRAKISNLDLRYEVYPGKGQLISGTFFYKNFENPIEQIARADVSNEITYQNVPKATNYGVELEVRSIIGSLFKSDSASILNNFTFYTNIAVIRSVVDVSQIVGSPYTHRPLQGQSPYVFNAGLTYFDDVTNMSFSANVNRVGNRIYILGSTSQPDIWEKSRTFLDFQASKSFWKNKVEVKLNFQNIFAQNQIFYQNNFNIDPTVNKGQQIMNSILTGDKLNRNTYNSKTDDLIWSTKFGRVISATVTIKL